jgi:hypothetical protein
VRSAKPVFYFYIPWRAASGVFCSRICDSVNPLGSRNHGITESVDPKQKKTACQPACRDDMAMLSYCVCLI